MYESLADLWPATRSTRVAAGIKVSCIVSAVADGVKSVKLFPERTSEIKTLRIGPWVKDRILLIDLGLFKYGIFYKIDKYNGFFVSRLKSNANPTIVTLNKKCRGNSISVEGKKLKDVLPHLKRGVLDVMVEVKFKRRKYRGERTTVTKPFRVVAVLNKETGDYHVYMTNIQVERWSAEDIASLYGARWGIEMTFKELKLWRHYGVGKVKFEKPPLDRASNFEQVYKILQNFHSFGIREHHFLAHVRSYQIPRSTDLFWRYILNLPNKVFHVG
ncbi:IS4 family transposase [Methanosarcinales archaeon]|nr:MAG: IS4 family transposase [Methanosarcinales archaeon]